MHAIRLRGPWRYRALVRFALLPDGTTRDVPATQAGIIGMPADWGETLDADFFGRVRYTRHFGRPTGLTLADRVELVFAEVRGGARAMLGDVPLGSIPVGSRDTRFDVSDRLLSRNKLIVDVEWTRELMVQLLEDDNSSAAMPGGLVGEVRLEIDSRNSLESR